MEGVTCVGTHGDDFCGGDKSCLHENGHTRAGYTGGFKVSRVVKLPSDSSTALGAFLGMSAFALSNSQILSYTLLALKTACGTAPLNNGIWKAPLFT